MEQVRAFLEEALRSDIALLDATNRALFGNAGKMLRPMVTLLSAGAGGGIGTDTVRFAAVTELMHNATLLHDDVVDGSPLRRGKPTVMSLLGGKTSVLIGDYWLVTAIRAILGASRYSEEAIRLFAKTLEDLAAGEILQLEKASSGDTTLDDYLRIIYDKSASLFEASALSGALSAGADAASTEALRRYAINLGLAFQMKDDILDYEGDERLGKPCGQDLREQKITLPLLCALDAADPAEAKAFRALVTTLDDRPEEIPSVLSFVERKEGVKKAEKVVEGYVKEAVSALEPLAPSAEKSYLATLAAFVADRNQ